jgi:hypothetical protein
MNASLRTTLLIAAAFLFGLYEIGYGFYAWRLNGFRFYVTAGFLIGIPFIIMGTVLLLLPRRVSPVWELLPLLLWIFGVGWKAWRKHIAKREHPQEWARWEESLHGP